MISTGQPPQEQLHINITAPMVISAALPPIPHKLANNILSEVYVEMKEFLPDTLMLKRQMELQDECSPAPVPLQQKSRICGYLSRKP